MSALQTHSERTHCPECGAKRCPCTGAENERLRDSLATSQRQHQATARDLRTLRERLERAIEYLEDPKILSGPHQVLDILRGED